MREHVARRDSARICQLASNVAANPTRGRASPARGAAIFAGEIMKKSIVLTMEQVQEAVNLFDLYKSAVLVSKAMGISVNIIRSALRLQGVTFKRGRPRRV